MTNTEYGKVYKIISSKSGRFYIGSTTDQLEKRYKSHKSGYILYRDCIIGGKYCTSYEVFEDEYPELPEMTLIERYPCEKMSELRAREAYHILTTECVNKNIPVRCDLRAIIEGMKPKITDENVLEELSRKEILRKKMNPDKIIDIF